MLKMPSGNCDTCHVAIGNARKIDQNTTCRQYGGFRVDTHLADKWPVLHDTVVVRLVAPNVVLDLSV